MERLLAHANRATGPEIAGYSLLTGSHGGILFGMHRPVQGLCVSCVRLALGPCGVAEPEELRRVDRNYVVSSIGLMSHDARSAWWQVGVGVLPCNVKRSPDTIL